MKPFTILCIFHKEKTPSLRIWDNGNFFCHGCQEQGNVLDFKTTNSTSYLSKCYNLYQLWNIRKVNSNIKYLEEMGQLKFMEFK